MAEQTYEYKCSQCETREWLPKWRYNQKTYPNLCSRCAKLKGYEKYKNIKTTNPEKWKKITKIKQEAATRTHAKFTREERSQQAKKRRACVKISGKEMRARQQHFINNASDQYYKNYCEHRRKIAQDFHDNMTDKEKEIHYRKILKNNGRSQECDIFIQELKNHQIECDTEQHIHGFIVDGIIQNTNIIIEYYGDMFHCNPRKFNNPSQPCSWLGGRTVQEQWDRDKRRLAALYRYGYIVIIVWGSEWKTNPNKVIARIQNEMCKH